jgi:type I restriction enzyme S subunit
MDAKLMELQEVATIKYGFPFDSKFFNAEKGTRIIRIRDINSNSEKTYFNGKYDTQYLVKDGDIIMGMDGEFNCIIWNDGEALLNQRIAKIIPDPSILDKRYLMYFLKVELKDIEEHTARSTVKHLLNSHLTKIKVPILPMSQQRSIATTLVKVDNVRDRCAKIQKLSNTYPLSLFSSMFDSGIGKWQTKNLGEVCEFLDNMRKPIKESDRKPGPYPYYGANGQVGTINDYIFDEPLMLLAEDGGNWNDPTRPIAYTISGKSWVNNHAHVLRPNNGFDLSFILYSIAHIDIQHLISSTTRGKLTKKAAESIPIIHAPLDLQREFGKRISAFKKVQENQVKSSEKLDLLFASLSNKYFNPVN